MAFEAELAAVRAAVEQAKPLANAFHTAVASFYDPDRTDGVDPKTPVLVCDVRVKKPKPSSFDAGNQTEWSTKRNTVIKAPMELPAPYQNAVIKRGLVVQIAPKDPTKVDGDPTIYNVNFIVQSAMTSQFAAEREISVTSELNPAPKVT